MKLIKIFGIQNLKRSIKIHSALINFLVRLREDLREKFSNKKIYNLCITFFSPNTMHLIIRWFKDVCLLILLILLCLVFDTFISYNM